MPVVGVQDRFEQAYATELKARLARYGQFVTYENDRAALDLGLHLYDPAAEPGTLIQAHVAEARMLVVATPQTVEVRQMIDTARMLNPKIEVAVRSHNPEEAALLEREHASRVFVGERELARAMTRHVLERVAGTA